MKNAQNTALTTPSTLTDRCLYKLCKKYGKLALLYRRKFIGLLPEVSRRRLYEQKGFSSIFEFAYKLAGLSEAQVKLALSLDRSFSDKPVLKKMLRNGEVSINKLVRITSVATVENQAELAEKVKILPNRALETLVRDMKKDVLHVQKGKNQNGLFKTHEHSERVSISKIQSLNLSSTVIEKLCELQNKGIDINILILEFLKEREEKIAREKLQIAQEQEKKILHKDKPLSRYIPAKIRKIITEEHGTKCAIPHCPKPARTIHHTARFSLSQNHNPHFLAPLCREHHILAHSLDRRFLDARRRN